MGFLNRGRVWALILSPQEVGGPCRTQVAPSVGLWGQFIYPQMCRDKKRCVQRELNPQPVPQPGGQLYSTAGCCLVKPTCIWESILYCPRKPHLFYECSLYVAGVDVAAGVSCQPVCRTAHPPLTEHRWVYTYT